jgi:hypothetical protein
MKIDTAVKISELLKGSIENMSVSLNLAIPELNPDELSKFKRQIGISLGELSIALELIYDKHPELMPINFK